MSSYSSQQILTALRKAGFEVVGQRGSHLKLRRVTDGGTLTVILPHPVKDLPSGTFGSLLRQAGLSRREFEDLL